jgi:hypothetical protein
VLDSHRTERAVVRLALERARKAEAQQDRLAGFGLDPIARGDHGKQDRTRELLREVDGREVAPCAPLVLDQRARHREQAEPHLEAIGLGGRFAKREPRECADRGDADVRHPRVDDAAIEDAGVVGGAGHREIGGELLGRAKAPSRCVVEDRRADIEGARDLGQRGRAVGALEVAMQVVQHDAHV